MNYSDIAKQFITMKKYKLIVYMKRNDNKEFQSQVIFSPKLVTKRSLPKSSPAVKILRQYIIY